MLHYFLQARDVFLSELFCSFYIDFISNLLPERRSALILLVILLFLLVFISYY